MQIPKSIAKYVGSSIIIITVIICVIALLNQRMLITGAIEHFNFKHKELSKEINKNTEATERLAHGLYSIDELYNMGKKYVKRKDGTRYVKTTVLTDEYFLQADSPFGVNPTSDMEICLSEIYLLLRNLSNILKKHNIVQFNSIVLELKYNLKELIDDYKQLKKEGILQNEN